jgi:predicted Zn-dependent protease
MAMVATIGLVFAPAAQAASLIRDTESEQILYDLSQPIFDQAGVSAEQVDLIILGDERINAFVAGGMNIFLHSGLIIETDHADQLIGVIAHEMGHIAGGHLIRQREAMDVAGNQSIISMVLGLAAAAATGNAEAAQAITLGGQTLATRNFMSHSRSQEAQADQAAINYLTQAGLPVSGLANFLDKLGGMQNLPAEARPAYLSTHPAPKQRADSIRAQLNQQTDADRNKIVSPDMVARFNRLRAKLVGFLRPDRVNRFYGPGDSAIPARYAHAIAAYRNGFLGEALDKLDTLINQEPKNPYFHELRGQMLFENGQVADAILAYQTALTYLEDPAPLIQIALGQALVADGHDVQAIHHLERAATKESDIPRLHRLLATAYGRRGQTGLAKLHLGIEADLLGRPADTIRLARQAMGELDPDSPAHQRATDLIRRAQEKQDK